MPPGVLNCRGTAGRQGCCGGGQLGACIIPPTWTGREACNTGFQVTQDLVMLLLSLPSPFLLSLFNICIVGITKCLCLNEVLGVFAIYCFVLHVRKAVPQRDQHLITLVTQIAALDLDVRAVLVPESSTSRAEGGVGGAGGTLSKVYCCFSRLVNL